MPKKELRKRILQKRRALAVEERRRKSLLIQQKLISTHTYSEARVAAFYSAIDKEVDTEDLINDALSSGKTVLLPVTSSDNVSFREIAEGTVLQPGEYGVLEPPHSGRCYDPGEADIIVLPGIAFDLNGNRIGYGKGCYDKLLHQLEGQGKIVALCYDFQVVDGFVGEPHDVRVDMIITEKRIIRPLSQAV